METWHINVGFKAKEPFTEDLPFDISECLESLAAVMSVSRDLDSGSIALTVDADTFTEALDTAREAVFTTLQAENVDPIVTSVMVQSDEEFEMELNEPVYPQVVSYAEIAKMAGVSRQRVRQLAEKATFPHPVIETGQGPLYSLHAVNHWLETRDTSRHAQTVNV